MLCALIRNLRPIRTEHDANLALADQLAHDLEPVAEFVSESGMQYVPEGWLRPVTIKPSHLL